MKKLRGYQLEAVERALQHDGFLVACEQRTGKTLIAQEILRRRRPKRLLITAPKIAFKKTWAPVVRWFKRGFPNSEVRQVTHQGLWKQRNKLRKWNPDMGICDESHGIKNRNSKQSKALRLLNDATKRYKPMGYRLALTGTPIGNGIWDAWAQFDWIDRSVFGEWDDFEKMYLVKGGYYKKQVIRTRNLKDFYRKFHSRSFRVELEEVSPVKATITETIVAFKLSEAESRPHYREMFEEFMTVVNDKRVVAPRVVTQVMKLHQLSGGFLIDEDKEVHWVGYEKVCHTAALVLKLKPTREKIVIVVKFIPEMMMLRALLVRLGFSVTLISGKHEFLRFDTDIAIIQIQSGVSIDLAQARSMIFHSFNHSYLNYDQARFRIREYGDSWAEYFFMLAKNTVDYDIYGAVRGKRSLSSYVLDKYRRK